MSLHRLTLRCRACGEEELHVDLDTEERTLTFRCNAHGLVAVVPIHPSWAIPGCAECRAGDPRFGGASHHYIAFAHGPNGYTTATVWRRASSSEPILP